MHQGGRWQAAGCRRRERTLNNLHPHPHPRITKNSPPRPCPSRTAAAARQLSYHPSCRVNCPIVHHYFHTSLYSGIREQCTLCSPLTHHLHPPYAPIPHTPHGPRPTRPIPCPRAPAHAAAPLPSVIAAPQRVIPSRPPTRLGSWKQSRLPPLCQPQMTHRAETPLSCQSRDPVHPDSDNLCPQIRDTPGQLGPAGQP